jgi:hypothetical protein
VNYYEFLTKFWQKNVTSPLVCNSVKAGTNGLYGEPETIYRNMAHWMLICDEISDVEASAASFIDSSIQKLQLDFTNVGPYKARTSKKDQSNGLIGTAWITEGLCELDNLSAEQSEIVIRLSIELLNLYPFDTKLGLWPNIVEPNGELGGIDRTFNHQLWMAASHAPFTLNEKNNVLNNRINNFMEHISKLLKISTLGTVYHTLGNYPHYHRTLIKRIIKPIYRKDMQVKEWGYHAFNLLGMVRVLKYKKNECLYNKLVELTNICDGEVFWKMQKGNVYGSHYNPVGIEVAVARDFIGYSIESVCEALNFHFDECFSGINFSFESDFDQATLNARLYEIKYLTKRTKSKLHFNEKNNRWACK